MLSHDFLALYVESLAGPVEGPAATVLERILELKGACTISFVEMLHVSYLLDK